MYKINDEVPNEQIQIIQNGIDATRIYLRDFLGGDITPEQQALVTIEIVSTGAGNPAPGAGGACCTALSEKGAHLFFDVLHPEWVINGQEWSSGNWSAASNLMKIAAHEYIHAWQHSLGCISIHDQPLGNWMNEGIAEYAGSMAMINRRSMSLGTVRSFQVESAIATCEMCYPLKELDKTNTPVWPGHIGYLAIDYLLKTTESDQIALRTICEQVGDGIAVDDAFQDVFGISKKDFYIEFSNYIKNVTP